MPLAFVTFISYLPVSSSKHHIFAADDFFLNGNEAMRHLSMRLSNKINGTITNVHKSNYHMNRWFINEIKGKKNRTFHMGKYFYTEASFCYFIKKPISFHRHNHTASKTIHIQKRHWSLRTSPLNRLYLSRIVDFVDQ